MDFDDPGPILDDEDEETLAAIDEGIRDAEAGAYRPHRRRLQTTSPAGYRLFFTERALNDLAEIAGYIADDDDEAATRFGTALLDHLKLLRRFPQLGVSVSKRSRQTGQILVAEPVFRRSW